LSAIAPSIRTEIRYHGAYNFLGTPVEGYAAPRCVLTRQAAAGVARAQASLQPQGLSLKVFDCYRPQRAVNHFLRWARAPEDPALRATYFPNLHKPDLLRQVYIADKSGHSRGSTVDLTIVWATAPAGAETHDGCTPAAATRGGTLDMGSGFDCFDPVSHTDSAAVTPAQRANRQLLRGVMRRAGFRNYEREWWHYTLDNEPFPATAFDFPVR
jgi:D-alanyl-D-alanine dipeptidase